MKFKQIIISHSKNQIWILQKTIDSYKYMVFILENY